MTGASRGIGKGIAIGLAEDGAVVYITGRTREQEHGVNATVVMFGGIASGLAYSTRDFRFRRIGLSTRGCGATTLS